MADPFESGGFHQESPTAHHAVTGSSDDDFFPKVHPEFSEHQSRTAKGKHSEQPDDNKAARDSNLTIDQWFAEAGRNFVHASVEDTANGIGQLINHSTDTKLLPNVELVAPAEQAQLGSSRWYAQVVGSGLGSIPAFVATDLLTRKVSGTGAFTAMRKFSDDVPVLKSIMGMENSARFVSPLAHSAVNGALYGSLFSPTEADDKDFWQQRGMNTLLASVCFTSQYGISHGAMDAIEKVGIGHMHFGAGSHLDTKTFLTHAGSNVLGGLGAGVIGSETYSVLANHEAASSELLDDSMARFALTSFGLDVLHTTASSVTGKVLGKSGHSEAHAELDVESHAEFDASPKSAEPQVHVENIGATDSHLNPSNPIDSQPNKTEENSASSVAPKNL